MGETEYGIGIVPLGGYVKMLGQDDNPGSSAEEQERIRIKSTNAAGEEEYELDPRSYPAKTVPQRMAIISAGVIMNLIFGVVFATVAYRYGVKYLPCVVGSTMPGAPAWTAGMQPGDKIVQLGKEGEPSDELRFTRELRFKVFETGVGNPLPVKVRRADDSEVWLNVTPGTLFKEQTSLPMIGIGAGSSNTVVIPPADEFSPAAKSELKEGDRIVKGIAGGSEYTIASTLDMNELLLAHADQAIEFEVERPDDPEAEPEGDSSKLTVTLPPQPVRLLGMWMEMNPVISVQSGSPADVAGVRPGDMLVSINGEPIADPMFIDDIVSSKIGEEVALTVKRGEEEVELTVTPRSRRQPGWPQRMGGDVSVESLGLAFPLADKVANVVDGGPAAAAGLQVGDQIVGVMTAAPADATFSPIQKAYYRIDEVAEFFAGRDRICGQLRRVAREAGWTRSACGLSTRRRAEVGRDSTTSFHESVPL